jgi:hypothetical protein
MLKEISTIGPSSPPPQYMFDFVISFFQRITKPPDSILISLLVAGRGRWYARNAPGSIGCAVQQAEQHVPAPAG